MNTNLNDKDKSHGYRNQVSEKDEDSEIFLFNSRNHSGFGIYPRRDNGF